MKSYCKVYSKPTKCKWYNKDKSNCKNCLDRVIVENEMTDNEKDLIEALTFSNKIINMLYIASKYLLTDTEDNIVKTGIELNLRVINRIKQGS